MNIAKLLCALTLVLALCACTADVALSDEPIYGDAPVASPSPTAVPLDERYVMSSSFDEPAEGDVAYTFADGVLTFSGEGSIPDVGDIENPWGVANDKIREIVIEEGITRIGHHAFKRCIFLESVTIPSSLVEIGVCAFFNCYDLVEITGGENIEYIDSNAFTATEWLDTMKDSGDEFLILGKCLIRYNGDGGDITLPSEVAGIGCDAFADCENDYSIS